VDRRWPAATTRRTRMVLDFLEGIVDFFVGLLDGLLEFFGLDIIDDDED
jgi:hypothetical protein